MDTRVKPAYDDLLCCDRLCFLSAEASDRLARIRHRRGQSAIHRDRLSVDVGRIVAEFAYLLEWPDEVAKTAAWSAARRGTVPSRRERATA